MSIKKNIAYFQQGFRGVAPGKFLKIYEYSNFFDPLIGVWNFLTPFFFLEFETFWPPFWSSKLFWPPPNFPAPPGIYKRSLIWFSVGLAHNFHSKKGAEICWGLKGSEKFSRWLFLHQVPLTNVYERSLDTFRIPWLLLNVWWEFFCLIMTCMLVWETVS